MKRKIVLVFLLAVLLIGFSDEGGSPADRDIQFVDSRPDGTSSMNWTAQVLRVKGTGFGPERVKSLGRRKVLARRAAQIDAARNLLERIQGVHVTSTTTVGKMMRESNRVKTHTEGLVKGMRVVEVKYSQDGSCEVTAEVSINEQGEFLLSALSSAEVKVIDDYPKFDWVALRDELEKKKVELADTKKKLDLKKKDLEKTKTALKAKDKELQEMQIQYAALKSSFIQQQTRLTSANEKLALMQEKLTKAQLRQGELEKALATAQLELAKTKQIVAKMRSTIDTTEDEFAEDKKNLDEVKNDLDRIDSKLADVSDKVQEYNSGDEGEPSDIESIRADIEQLNNIQKNMDGRVKDLYSSDKNLSYQDKPYEAVETTEYTGLLVDARELNLKPVLAPFILNEEHEKVYGIGVIPSSVQNGAIADYLTGGVEKARKYSKIGDNPLVVKAVDSVGESDVVVSNSDVEKMADIYDLLEKQKVAILM